MVTVAEVSEMVNPSRALLFENGAALGVFHAEGDGNRCRGGRSVVVMEPSGASFTYVRQVRETDDVEISCAAYDQYSSVSMYY